jgi:type IV secretion system protein VirD4
MSERTEETALLPEDEARRMDLDDIVLVVDAQMPVRAKRIKYYEDRFFKETFDKQSGELPYPSASDQMRGLQGQIRALEQKIGAMRVSSESEKKSTKRAEIANTLDTNQVTEMNARCNIGDYEEGTDRLDRFIEYASNI